MHVIKKSQHTFISHGHVQLDGGVEVFLGVQEVLHLGECGEALQRKRIWNRDTELQSWLGYNLSIVPYHPFEVADLHVQNVHGDGIAEPLQLLVQLGVLIIELVLDVLVDEVDWKADA